MSDLQKRARHARENGDAAAATAVFNLAALVASDCGMPDLARTWCHRLATVALTHGNKPQHALEPIVNLARLHIRAGNGSAAWTLLEALFQAVDTRTDITIDGITIPVALLTDKPETHAETRKWLWTVLLGTGAHALATAGRWEEASQRLSQYKGIGTRMLDGRQVAIIAHTVAGRNEHARAMLNATQPSEPWENAVTACLSLHVPAGSPADATAAALTAYERLDHAKPGLAVFHLRLGLIVIDALEDGHPARGQITASLIRQAISDGYAARDLLANQGHLNIATIQQVRQLNGLVSSCGLARGTMSTNCLATIDSALSTARSVIECQERRQSARGVTEPPRSPRAGSDPGTNRSILKM
ncbi:hypothetical protein J2S43_001031 [Catenuloplanes nepalensis]|uniref:Uncharacterized protein n=1 Tax=Catenuloplanes nepalensis TaxID=587533 RepID=A0ABT9MM77_9ACTN|nr:hypothetical protein [Catenuloplanes nepalensis]MDP9792519.1 hypothetical protein [Catenuloplanes nepalensis]